MKKPNPFIFTKALQQLGVKPEESNYVGDHTQNDIQAAQAVGMKGVWKKNSWWNEKEVQAAYTINELTELLTIEAGSAD